MVLFGGKSKDTRPVFLDLTVIHLPRTALVSILHRVSGVGLILSYPLLVALMYATVFTWQNDVLDDVITHVLFKIFSALILMGSGYHLLAGLRHVFADIFGLYDLSVGQSTADFVLFLWVAWSLYVIYGVWF